MAEVTCTSRHRPGARWFKGEDRTLTCELRPGHLVLWHRRDGFEWDDDHAELESGDSGA